MLLQFYGTCFQRTFGAERNGAWRRSEQGKGRREKEEHRRAGHGAAEMGQDVQWRGPCGSALFGEPSRKAWGSWPSAGGLQEAVDLWASNQLSPDLTMLRNITWAFNSRPLCLSDFSFRLQSYFGNTGSFFFFLTKLGKMLFNYLV